LSATPVNYAVPQTCPTLAIGKVAIGHPAQPNEDLAKLQGKGAKVYVVQEDLDERGLDKGRRVPEAQPIKRAEIADLMEQHDQIWHW
jgi:sulfur relay protein TusB/DsrH